uniref:Uncharacterized protein n=1 Tax=Cucumis melo TaxID=3656 RepID=A0A9I9D182_CUCME
MAIGAGEWSGGRERKGRRSKSKFWRKGLGGGLVEIDGVWRELYNGDGGGAHLKGIIVATAIDGACYGFSQGPITIPSTHSSSSTLL